MDFETLHSYFRAEKAIGFTLIPVGLALVGLGIHIVRAHAGAFMWGAALPLLLVGLGAAAGGAVLAWRTGSQVPALEARYAESPAAMVAEEQARMAKVNGNWPILKGIWTGLVVLGLVLIWGIRRDWALGLGPSLLLLAAIVMMVDVFAERRARVYAAALDAAGARP